MQRVVSEILGCWDENGLEIEAIRASRSAGQAAFAVQAAREPALLAAAAPSFNISQTTQTGRTDQALVFSSVALEVPKSDYSRPLLAMAAVGLMLLGLSSVIAITRGFGGRIAPISSSTPAPEQTSTVAEKKDTPIPAATEPPELATVPEASRKAVGTAAAAGVSNRKTTAQRAETENSRPAAASDRNVAATAERTEQSRETSSKAEPVRVNLRIENGRVAEASIANHKPGMDAVEALALRIARQRRYPGKGSGPETVVIKVTPSN